jgi:hypothetical protein
MERGSTLASSSGFARGRMMRESVEPPGMHVSPPPAVPAGSVPEPSASLVMAALISPSVME